MGHNTMSDNQAGLVDFAMFRPGENVGTSEWVTVDQPMISGFGDITLDPDPMHVDPEWAAENSAFGRTIAFGFLTMSLLTHLLHSAMGDSNDRDHADVGYFLNYGFDRMRLVSPIPVDSRVRGHFKTLENYTDEKDRQMVKFECHIEIEGEERPALIGEWLAIWINK
jgi:acyl dehydratase